MSDTPDLQDTTAPRGRGRDSALAWFCLRARPKQEHLAAAHLRSQEGVEVFVPRIRFRRVTRRGPVWVTEALFPNYLFARFNWKLSFRLVHYSPNLTGVVHFGANWPTIPDEVMDELRSKVGEEDIRVIPPEMGPGDPVKIAGGSFHGLQGVVQRVMPSGQRVAVLLEFLGRQTPIEISIADVIQDGDQRRLIV